LIGAAGPDHQEGTDMTEPSSSAWDTRFAGGDPGLTARADTEQWTADAALDATIASDETLARAVGLAGTLENDGPGGGYPVQSPSSMLALVELYGLAAAGVALARAGVPGHGTLEQHLAASVDIRAQIARALGFTSEPAAGATTSTGARLQAEVTVVHDGLGMNEHQVALRTLTGTLFHDTLDIDGPRWVVAGIIGASNDALGAGDITAAQQWAESVFTEHARGDREVNDVPVDRWEHHRDAYGEWWVPIYTAQ
jgi:hypothetical protein